MLVNIEGTNIEGEIMTIKDRKIAYRIALSILTTLAFTENKKEDEDKRPKWPGKDD